MGLFSSGSSDVRYGAIVDIGSGSVMVGIVRSEFSKEHPTVLWSKREYVLLKETGGLQQSARNILTALMNAIVILGNEGTVALREVDSGAKINHMQVSISAPWAYTISKTVSLDAEEPFEITKQLITELTEAAQKKTLEEIKENEITEILGLDVIARTTTDIIANGYRTGEPFGQMASSISLAHVSAVAQLDLIDTAEQTKDKLLPTADLQKFSFMLMYYCVIRELYPAATEFCLVDVTYEATEIAIIRDGILRYATHAPVGMYTLAREIVANLNIPPEEAFTHLTSTESNTPESLSEKDATIIRKVTSNYQKVLGDLFKQTGDTLSIPKTIFLHTDPHTEHFFHKQINAGAELATHGSHIVHEVTAELLTSKYTPEEKQELEEKHRDTSLLVSAQFFHKQHHCRDFEQL